MNINLRELEVENFGAWPMPVKILLIVCLTLFLFIAGFWLDTRDQIQTLDAAKNNETELLTQFEQKQDRASNLQAYKNQMKVMKETFGTLLRQLPEKTEVPGLVEDISQQGLATGLEFRTIKLQPEKAVDFYVELPIEITVSGTYHQLATFVSNVASLPRIVTLHNFAIQPVDKAALNGQLLMTITAKTYRYTAEGENKDASTKQGHAK